MTAPGYKPPVSTVPLPKRLTLNQFIQTVIAGVSGLPGALVRTKWQTEPPKDPDIEIDWISFGVSLANPDANGYVGVNDDGTLDYQRHEDLEVALDLFGPDCLEIAGLIRDGFQIDQNRVALQLANMGFVNVSGARFIPDLVNERFVQRRVMSIFLRRQVQRTYPIPTLLSCTGTVYTVQGAEEFLTNFQIPNPPPAPIPPAVTVVKTLAAEDGQVLETETGGYIVDSEETS